MKNWGSNLRTFRQPATQTALDMLRRELVSR